MLILLMSSDVQWGRMEALGLEEGTQATLTSPTDSAVGAAGGSYVLVLWLHLAGGTPNKWCCCENWYKIFVLLTKKI